MSEIRIAQIMGKWLGGGVESVVMNYYRNIDRTKVQFDFFCDSDSTCIPYEEIESLGGKVIIIPPYQKIIDYRKALKLELKKGNYKIVHSHISTMSIFPLQIAKKAGIPIRIAHCHSTTNKKDFKKNILKHILRPFSKTFSTHYMCCSKLAGEWLFGKKTYKAGKVYLLNNAINCEKFSYDLNKRLKIRNELNIANDCLVIGHIGRFVTQKNHKFLINIFSEIKKINKNSLLLLVGLGPLFEDIKNYVSEKNLENSVKFLNQRNDADYLYSAFDVFVLPSLYEGLPVVGVEAQCADLNCYFSDQMTEETKIIDKTRFLSLDSAICWANSILSFNFNSRCSRKLELKSANFDIKTEAIKLENYYLDKY
ncbi:MAG: glycosyltransferase family 1 protein [Treponema sp.]|nr:glycosyltransferase family 1 protein [Treponema sp.]